VPPTHKTQPQEPSEEISALKSEETSATDQIQLNQPREKSTFGSRKNNKSTTGLTTQKNGFTNDPILYTFLILSNHSFLLNDN